MITCSNCGFENASDSRFCANCGASLLAGGRAGESVSGTPTGPSSGPSAPVRDPSQLPPTSPDWRMSDAGPLPPPPRRPMWLWFILGALGLCLLICVGFYIWTQTLGQEFVAGFLATAESAMTATAEATNPSAVASPGGDTLFSGSASGTPAADSSPVAGGALSTPLAGGTPEAAPRTLFGGTPASN